MKFQAVTIKCNEKNYYSFRISKPLFTKIIAKLDKEMGALEVVRLLWQEAEKRIERIIADMWEWKLKMLSWTM